MIELKRGYGLNDDSWFSFVVADQRFFSLLSQGTGLRAQGFVKDKRQKSQDKSKKIATQHPEPVPSIQHPAPRTMHLKQSDRNIL